MECQTSPRNPSPLLDAATNGEISKDLPRINRSGVIAWYGARSRTDDISSVSKARDLIAGFSRRGSRCMDPLKG